MESSRRRLRFWVRRVPAAFWVHASTTGLVMPAQAGIQYAVCPQKTSTPDDYWTPRLHGARRVRGAAVTATPTPAVRGAGPRAFWRRGARRGRGPWVRPSPRDSASPERHGGGAAR